MGLGDQIMATGLAREPASRGKRTALGDGGVIRWDGNSAVIFRDNPHIAKPGDEGDADLEWIPFYKGNRIYNKLDRRGTHWLWNLDFKAVPGQFFFDADEQAFANAAGAGVVVIEPNVPNKPGALNKVWRHDRFEDLATALARRGHYVIQFLHGGTVRRLRSARLVSIPTIRHAAAALSQAELFIGAEGGLHHAAAAVGTRAVVLFGGFIPPAVTGYDFHVNLTGGAETACGSLEPCEHCRQAMERITVDQVLEEAETP